MSLDWRDQSDGTRMATGHETVYVIRVLRDISPGGNGTPDIQVECRMTGDRYPRLILRGENPARLFVEANSIEEDGVLPEMPEPNGGWYKPTETGTR